MNTPTEENNMVIELIVLTLTTFTTGFTLGKIQLMLKGH